VGMVFPTIRNEEVEVGLVRPGTSGWLAYAVSMDYGGFRL
jgi:hypothetical protein